MKIGVIGLGRIGKIHLKNLVSTRPDITVVASDPIEEAQQYARQLGIAQIHSDYQAILDDSEVEAALICTPTDTHADLIKKFAQAGKHLFCEKPLDLSIHTIREIISVVESSGVKLMIGFNRRFDASFAKVGKLLQSGKIGQPHILKITSRDPTPAPIEYLKFSGGIFLDMTIHDFDMARFILGSEVEQVFAKGAVLVDQAIAEIGDLDTAVTTLTFENGAIAIIDNSRKAVYGYDQRLEIFGSKGMAKVENHKQDEHTYYNETGSHQALLQHFFLDRYEQAYCKEIEAFLNALANDEAMPVTAHDGLTATAIALAAGKSAKENRPVRVEEVLPAQT